MSIKDICTDVNGSSGIVRTVRWVDGSGCQQEGHAEVHNLLLSRVYIRITFYLMEN